MPIRAADDGKMRELILYVLQRSEDDPHMGATKLNKVLFRSDFGAFHQLGEAITWHPYRKLENGPAPRHLVDIRKSMVADGLVKVERREVGAAKPMDRWIPMRRADTTKLTEAQLAVVDRVLAEMREQTGTDASDDTHLMVGWRIAPMFHDIPYGTALLADHASRADIERGRELAALHGWT